MPRIASDMVFLPVDETQLPAAFGHDWLPSAHLFGSKTTHTLQFRGCTELMKAAYNGDVAQVKELVDNGSLRCEEQEMCKLLVEQGDADIMAQDDGGKTAFDLAMRAGPFGSDAIRDLVAGVELSGGTWEWQDQPGSSIEMPTLRLAGFRHAQEDRPLEPRKKVGSETKAG
eukprot:Skav215114  [mRNA]  locus=scaffold1893:295125:303468:- [translate_table: standard]